MKVITKITIFVLFVVFVFGAAYAQFAKPEDAIKYRKSVMFLIAQHFKRMGAVIQGKSAYKKEAFSANADVVLVKLVDVDDKGFLPDSGDLGRGLCQPFDEFLLLFGTQISTYFENDERHC